MAKAIGDQTLDSTPLLGPKHKDLSCEKDNAPPVLSRPEPQKNRKKGPNAQVIKEELEQLVTNPPSIPRLPHDTTEPNKYTTRKEIKTIDPVARH